MGESKRPGGFMGALRRMVSSTAERDAEDMRRLAEEQGARPVDECVDRERVSLVGTIRSVTIPPPEEPPRLEAEFDDGSGQVKLIFMGRRSISGIQAGSILRIEGRLSCQRGQRKMFNPRYELTHVPGID
ncbi:OB-fold nucleic acid binding domain-containing protein [Granulicoccus sp. GXG6511]|uniref:OB-fold nucleic acid binding domain-containing protein n=1 Tax=Granulicoccus sp. GXG6511 TaxID=3381351 RepID=UPI003D7CE75E